MVSSANSASVRRCPDAVICMASCFAGAAITTLPFSLPLYFSKSASTLIFTMIGSPVTVPSVPAVHANGMPISGWY